MSTLMYPIMISLQYTSTFIRYRDRQDQVRKPINHSCRRVKKENATFEAVQNSSHKNPLNPSHQTFHTTHLHLTSRRILVSKVFIALAFDESVHPRKLRFLLAELPVQVCVCAAIDTVLRRPVWFSLIGVVEPSIHQSVFTLSNRETSRSAHL